MFKKLFLGSILVLALIGGSLAGHKQYTKTHQSHPPNVVQVRASHMLSFLSEDGTDTVGVCTGLVLGPHAILSAAHCNEGDDAAKTLRIDRSTRIYSILAASFDGRDHMIILVDGPAFTDIAPYVVRAPKIGESVFVEGFGEEVYPAVQKAGKIIEVYDPSEVDAEEQMFHFTNAVIHGDSGSAVFGADGAILGVVTWRMEDGSGSGYQLDYPPLIIYEAQTFQGLNKK